MKALLWCVMWLAGASPVEEDLAELEARLASERASLIALDADKTQVLSLLDTLERLARISAQRALLLERQVAKANKRVLGAQAAVDETKVLLAQLHQRLAPGLVALYRLHRKQGISQVLMAGDFASLIKQQRAVRQVVDSDIKALNDIALMQRWQQRQIQRWERWSAIERRALAALSTERAVGELRMAEMKELLANVTAQQQRMQRVVAELEHNERVLARLVSELKDTSDSSGFRARRGQLPAPVKGVVEVGFGKVVNARFKTVTEQKGLDVRAPEGSQVSSVGQGIVAYVGWLKGYGNLVIVDHGSSYHSLYAHLAEAQVEVGQAIEEGDALGLVGDTGSLKGTYLYFEIRKNGEAVDPLPWLKPEHPL